MAITKDSAHLIARGGSHGAGGDKTCNLWLLACTENAAAVETAGALDALAGFVQKGDVIIASMVRTGTPVGQLYIVTAASASSVTVAAFIDATGS